MGCIAAASISTLIALPSLAQTQATAWPSKTVRIIVPYAAGGVTESITRLLALSQRSETGERPHASVAFAAGAVEMHAESDGNGPVDASLKAIESKLKTGAEMLLYSVNAITSGSTESQGEVTVRLQHGGRVVNGVGADPDIVVASAKAYLSALNKLHSKTERVAAQG